MSTPADLLEVLAASGTTGRLIAERDWTSTPLGPPTTWPACLRTALAAVLRSPVAMTLLWGAHGVLLYNDAYAVVAGPRHPHVLGANVLAAWPEAAEFNSHVLRTVLAGATLTYRDHPIPIERDGRLEPSWFTLDYWPVIDESGAPAGIMALVVDTTRKVHAEAWLRDETDRLRRLFEQAPGFMAMLRGPTHVFELVNPAYEQLIGHRNVLGRAIRDALPDIEAQGFHDLIDSVYASGEAYTGSSVAVVFRHHKGASDERRFVDFVLQPVRDAAGAVVGVFIQGADVTDRVLSEQHAAVVEQRNRQILDSAVDYAIVAFDLDGRVTRWNEGAHRVLGWTEAEMLGHDAECMFTPEDRLAGRMAAEMHAALVGGVGDDQHWHVRKSGERFWAQGELTPIRAADGSVTGFVKVLRDRTDQHVAALALRESEARLHRAQAAGGVGTFTCDIGSNQLHVTPEFCRIFGISVQTAIDAGVVEALVLPDDRHVVSSVDTRRREAAPLSVEYRIRRPGDDAIRWIARSAEFESDAAGHPMRMVGVVQDVTSRKAAQRTVEESARQFLVFAQAMPNHIWTAPPSGQLDWFNERTYEYSGAARGELDGAGWASIVHPDELDEAARRWAESIESGQTYEAEFRLRDASGVYRWHLARAMPLLDADGAVTRWIGSNTDIHERKVAEAVSNRERDRIWALSRELMLVCDFDGLIAAVNPAASRILGWDEAEMVGHRLAEFLHPDDMAATAAEVGKLSEGATTLSFENRYRAKDGAYRSLSWTAVPEGAFIHAVARDITEQLATEAALRQSQKMEAVGQLTGGIAHDFNNLLQGITGSLELVQKRTAQGRTADAERFIGRAMASARRAAALTHRLLAFSRRQPLDPRPVEANTLIGSMEDLIRRTLGENIGFETRLAPDLWLTRCDPNQLESAILNLTINARDAMPGGGQLTIATTNERLDAATAQHHDVEPGRYVRLSVTDTGTGMAAETMSKAFEPFFTTKPIGQGTGLGLSMVYGFARQSDGCAEIRSELGAGSTVELYLPRFVGTAPLEESAPEGSKAPAAHTDATVLVVEDEPDVRALIVQVLAELGYSAIEAADGPAGLAQLESDRRIDLLITDIGLPGLNGTQVAAAGRELRPGLKVLFITGYAETAAASAGFLEPGMALLTKPFTLEALARRIGDIVEEAPQRDS